MIRYSRRGVARFVGQLDELVAAEDPAAIVLAEHIRLAKAEAWAEGHETDEHGFGDCDCDNPYEIDRDQGDAK